MLYTLRELRSAGNRMLPCVFLVIISCLDHVPPLRQIMMLISSSSGRIWSAFNA